MVTPEDPVPDPWEWTHAPTIHVVGPPSEVHTWPVITHMAGTEAEAFTVSAVQAGRAWRAPNARLLATRQRAWVNPYPELSAMPPRHFRTAPGAIVALQMQLDVLLIPGPGGHYMEYEVLPASNTPDQKEG